MTIEFYTDGSSLCTSTKPHEHGGCAMVVVHNNKIIYEQALFLPLSKIGKCELRAAMLAYEFREINSKLCSRMIPKIYSDSMYTINSLTKWINNWRSRGWIKHDGQDVKNSTLLEAIYQLQQSQFVIPMQHVKGHAGNQYNERADWLANDARINQTNYYEWIK